MKKYIAPEMEVVNFKAIDVLTTSGEPSTPVTITANATADLAADAAITFSSNGAF